MLACRGRCVAVVLLTGLHIASLVWGAAWQSPTTTELPSMVAGVRHWQTGRFDLFRVNPPLVRLVAALPVMLWNPVTDWSDFHDLVATRPEFKAGESFVRLNGKRSFWLFMIARWACIPISVIGLLVCYCWGRDLYGYSSGIIATMLWCFSPSIVAHAQLITYEASAAAVGVLAGYSFWRWLKKPTWPRMFAAAVVLGLAELSKTIWIVLFGLWPLLWLIWQLSWTGIRGVRGWCRESLQIATICVVGFYVLNMGYGFEGTFQRLGDYRFVSETLAGTKSRIRLTKGANRFQGSYSEPIRVPLPESYVLGIDIQKRDFETQPYSYLAGTWRTPGWWYYYLYALAVKVPLGTWCLVALAVGMTIVGRRKRAVPDRPSVRAQSDERDEKRDSPQYAGCSTSWRDEMVVLAPGLAILVFVSSQTGFSVHSRYVIPALPFFFIWTSKVARVFGTRPFPRRRLVMATTVVMALTWSVGSSLAVYPHSLSYFNEFAAVLPTPADATYPTPIDRNDENRSVLSAIISAGPRNGPRHLLDSNIDWGQDLFYLEDWYESHPKARPIKVAYFGGYPLDRSKVKSAGSPPAGPDREQIDDKTDATILGPLPGWYALSVNEIYSRSQEYRYFLHFEPVATAGYSIYIYHITPRDANRVRREMGLPPLPEDSGT